jgi:hypothetical protein
MIVSSPIAVDSVGGIIWGASRVPGGAQTPQGSRSSASEIRSVFRHSSISFQRPGRFYWDRFQLIPMGITFRTSFPACSGYRISPGSPIFADLSVHASDLPSSSDHGYFYVICLYSSDDPCDLTDDYILYFQYIIVFPCLSLIIHIIGRLMFFISACIIYILFKP